MELTAPLVLPSDVVLTPTAQLSESLRRRTEGEEGDYAISRPGSRSASKLLDQASAALVEKFRTPSTIIDAVIRFGRETHAEPERILEDAFPVLMHLIHSRFLVEADATDASGIRPTLEPNDPIPGGTVVRCLHLTEDSEVYEIATGKTTLAAAKILRPGFESSMMQSLEHEAAILRHLRGDPSPFLLEAGTYNASPYLLTEWCGGADASVIADQLRQSSETAAKSQLLELAVSILEAYERLHAKCVIHGDINPRNVVVAPNGTVRLLDFGLARLEGDEARDKPPRGGWVYLYEPEAADAFRRGHAAPPPTRLGEQYSLAALLYLLFTGSWYVEFSATAAEMYRQIAEEPPLRFIERGSVPWPDVERILNRALSKDPRARFEDVTALKNELYLVLKRLQEQLQAPQSTADRANPSGALRKSDDSSRARRTSDYVNEVLKSYEMEGGLLTSEEFPPPTVSVGYGRAGVAHAIFRIACARDNPKLMALADVWSTSGLRRANQAHAFTNPALGVTDDVVGAISSFFGPPGPQVVRAIIAAAMGDDTTRVDAIQRFVQTADRPCANPDLTLGLASSLVAAALAVNGDSLDEATRGQLESFGDRVLHSLWDSLSDYGSIARTGPVSYLGIAHGWAGILYGTLLWCSRSKSAIPGCAMERLGELRQYAEPVGHGLRWPVQVATQSPGANGTYLSGWCHGSAGHAALWTLAYRMFKEDDYLLLAEGAARYALEDSDGYPTLCCGLAGRAYALLDLFQCTGDRKWAERARMLAHRAIDGTKAIPSQVRNSLYKGELGVATLVADVERPEAARFPFFQTQL